MKFNVELASTSFSGSSSALAPKSISESAQSFPKCFGRISSLLMTQVPYPMLLLGSGDGIVLAYS